MNIQTISIVVPTAGCVNKCSYCVSRMHKNPNIKIFDDNSMSKRIKWAVTNGVNTCILTGTGEALQNKEFLHNLSALFNAMDQPFPNVELQTTGVLLDNSNIKLLKSVGVNTISISVADIFDDKNNMKIINTPGLLQFKIDELIQKLKNADFNIRLSLNLTNSYEKMASYDLLIPGILKRCKDLGADQVTFRKLFAEDNDSEQSIWVKENKCKEELLGSIYYYIEGSLLSGMGKGKPLYELPFGAMVYSIMGMSVVIDRDCMNKSSTTNLKYVILRENGKLYSQWDDEGSLIF